MTTNHANQASCVVLVPLSQNGDARCQISGQHNTETGSFRETSKRSRVGRSSQVGDWRTDALQPTDAVGLTAAFNRRSGVLHGVYGNMQIEGQSHSLPFAGRLLLPPFPSPQLLYQTGDKGYCDLLPCITYAVETSNNS
jgi:hypothetical protein